MDTKMWYIYTMEYYSAIKNDEFMKFLDKWILAQKLQITRIQFIDHMKLKKKCECFSPS